VGQNFSLALNTGIALVEPYETHFIYDENHIKKHLIPDLIELRNALLLDPNRNYNSHLPTTHENFGKSNDDPSFSIPSSPDHLSYQYADYDGPSYKLEIPLGTDTLEVEDEVWKYNEQIRLWEEALRLNEWEKAFINNQDTIEAYRQKELDRIESERIFEGFGLGVLATTFSATALLPLPGIVMVAAGFALAYGSSSIAVNTATLLEAEEREIRRQRVNDRFDELIDRAETPINYSISGGAAFTLSSSQSLATSTRSFTNYMISAELGGEIKAISAGSGFDLERSIGIDVESGRDWGEDTDSTSQVSFTLYDPDQGDFFSVDVYPSILGYGPIFKRRPGGQTACPHEPAEVAEYLGTGSDTLSFGTRAHDKPTISVSQNILTNIPADKEAVFNITLGNAAFTNFARNYNVQTVSSSNPHGAIVRIDGIASISPTIPGLTEINKVLTVKKGAGNIHQYDSLLIIIYAPCQYSAGTSDNVDIADSIYISAHFIPECSDLSIAIPEDQWILNNSFNDTFPIVLNDYNINHSDLERIRLDYKPSNESTWRSIMSFWKDTSLVDDPLAIEIPRNSPQTVYEWEVGDLNDGGYDLRAVSLCENSLKSAEIHSGYMDRINPHAFGDPSPGDGILGPNDQILIKFNEVVDLGSITSKNFDIRGVLNGSDLRHQESIAFDGVNDYLEIPEYNLSQRSFTLEYWAKRNSTGKQVVFSQGLSTSHQIMTGWDNDDRAFMLIGDKMIKSNNPISDLNNWYHYTYTFDNVNNTAEVFVNSNQAGKDISTSNTFSVNYTGAGRMTMGMASSGTPYMFNGFLHEVRLWDKVKTLNEIVSSFNISLGGRELGLIGNWPMDEAWGSIAYDKVRGRHASLMGASWSILPKGNAYHFDEPQEFLVANNAGSLAFSRETDLTFEFWAKGMPTGSPMSILSNGLADGSGLNTAAWSIFFDASGKIVVLNDSVSIQTPESLLDNDWHHFSAVVNRLGNISLYVDGQLVNSELATDYKEFGGPNLYIGCRGWKEANQDTVDQFFSGDLDDIRIWNLARTSDQINRDFVNALTGDELGLEAYFPFDHYREELGVPVLDPTLNDKSVSDFDYDLSIENGSDSYSQQTAPIKLARPVKKVNYTYSVNQDEIVISLNDDPALIENVTLDITVSGISDLARNFMEAPRTWIAYVDKNQVYWNEEYMEFEKMEGDPLTFEANVRNSGGASQSYVIGNLPSWITASPSAGVIDPNSSIKVTFTVNPLMEIGEFTQDIYVTGDFGYNEKLVVGIKNIAEPPQWDVNPSDFDYNMNLTGILTINDVISIDEDDIVGAFIDDQLVGFSPVQFFEEQAVGLVILTINSNVLGLPIDFRVWDASAGRLLVDVTPSDLTFVKDTIIGIASNPLSINALAFEELTYNVSPGWNWISFPNNGAVLNNFDDLFSDLSLTQNDQLSTLGGFTEITDTGIWNPLSPFDSINVESGYKLFTAHGGQFKYEGIFEDPNDHKIPLRVNWNWVGMIAEQNLDINTALATLNPVNGDIIKSQRKFAVYDELFGWVGNLNTLIPQEGYLIKLNSHIDTLIYPSSLNSINSASTLRSGSLASDVDQEMKDMLIANLLDFNESKYANNMNIVAQIDSCHFTESYDMWYLCLLYTSPSPRD